MDIKGPGFIGEYDAGLAAAVATMGALFWCGLNGCGQHIDISKQETLMALDKMELARFQTDGQNPSRGPSVAWVPPRPMRTKDDGYILIDSGRDNQWRGLVELMGYPEWTKDEKFSTDQGRHEHIGEGFIGLEPFGFFLNDPRLQQIPFLLETPVKDDPGDNQRNLRALRSLLP